MEKTVATEQKIVISGGTGFIGRALAQELLNRSSQIIILTRQTGLADRLPGAVYLHHDFSKLDQKQYSGTALQGATTFIHLAAEINWQSMFSPEMYCSFRAHVVNVLRFVETLGDSLDKVVFGSSIMVYPMAGTKPFVEECDEDPGNFYGTDKLVFEEAMAWLAKQKGINFLSARIGQAYGPRMRVNRILPDTIEKARRGDDILLFGDGSQATDWTYIEDVIQGLTRMIEYPGSGFYNIGTGQGTSNTDLARACIKILKSGSTIRYLPDKIVPERRQVLDLTKSRKALSYQPRYDFEAGLSAMLGITSEEG